MSRGLPTPAPQGAVAVRCHISASGMKQPEVEGTWHLLQDLGEWACSPDEQTLDLNSEGLGEVSWEIAVGRKVLSGEGNSPDNTFLELHREGGSGGT